MPGDEKPDTLPATAFQFQFLIHIIVDLPNTFSIAFTVLPRKPKPLTNSRIPSSSLGCSQKRLQRVRAIFYNGTVNTLTRRHVIYVHPEHGRRAPRLTPNSVGPDEEQDDIAETIPKPVFPCFFYPPSSSPSVWVIVDVPSLTMSTPKAVSDFKPVPPIVGPHWASPMGLVYADCSCHRSTQSHISHPDTHHYQRGLETNVSCNERGRHQAIPSFPYFRSGPQVQGAG